MFYTDESLESLDLSSKFTWKILDIFIRKIQRLNKNNQIHNLNSFVSEFASLAISINSKKGILQV